MSGWSLDSQDVLYEGFKQPCVLPHCFTTSLWCLSTQKYPHFNTALHWMTDPPPLSRSFVFAPQWYGNSTLSQWDSFLPPPVSLLKAHSNAILPLRDSLEHGGTFVSLVLSSLVYFYSEYSAGISPWFVCLLRVTLPCFGIICLPQTRKYRLTYFVLVSFWVV